MLSRERDTKDANPYLFGARRLHDSEAVPILSMQVGLRCNGSVLLVVEEDKVGRGGGMLQGSFPGNGDTLLQISNPC